MGTSLLQGSSAGSRPIRPTWLMPVILVALREWNSYGYEFTKRVTDFGFETINPGMLCRTLKQMEENGLVKSSWETSKGDWTRGMYSITDVGEAYLDFWTDALEQYRNNIDAFLRIYRGLVGAADGREDSRRAGKMCSKPQERTFGTLKEPSSNGRAWRL